MRGPGRGRHPAHARSGLGKDGLHPTIEVPGYEILEEVGRGGMGVVFKARQVSLDRIVALKVIRDIFCATGDDWSRFLAEAEAVAALHHPGIVQIHECGQAAGIPFMALEFVEGGSLAEEVADRLLPPREAAAIVQQVAQAVQHAHSRGTIHRDLKPENVLLTADGRPLVSDFGLARRLQDAQQKTLTGTVLGTPGYMAPEQAAGRTHDVGVPTDIYGLGAILYRLITGRPPFQAAETITSSSCKCCMRRPSGRASSMPASPRIWRRFA